MNIGVDIDGVLADFNTAYIATCIELSGRDLFPPRPFDIPTWNYPEHYGYTKDEVSAVWRSIKHDESFWFNLPEYDDARQALGNLGVLELMGHSIYFVTSRPGDSAKFQTEAWLAQRGFDRATVLISSAKGLCAQALDIAFYVDDRWENVLDVATTSKAMPFLVDRPWNRGNNPEQHGIVVVSSALDFTNVLSAPTPA